MSWSGAGRPPEGALERTPFGGDPGQQGGLDESAVEVELADLLSWAEQAVERLKGRRLRSRPTAALEEMAEMIERFLASPIAAAPGETRLRTFESALSAVVREIPEGSLLLCSGESVSVRSAVRLYAHWADGMPERSRFFQRLCMAQLRLLEMLVRAMIERNLSGRTADEWNEAVAVFRDDLGRSLASVRF